MPLKVIEFVAPAIEALAQGLGYFEEEGVELEIRRTRSSVEQRAVLRDGACDVGLTAIDNIIAWNGDGDDLLLLAQVERTTVLDLIARPSIENVAGLRGKTLAVDAVTNGFAIALRQILADHGVGEGSYEMTPAGGINERFEALTSGVADAGLLGPPWSLQAIEQGLHRLTTVEAELRDFPGIGVVVRAARIEELRPRLTPYLRALDRAARWAAADNREAALEILAQSGFKGAGAVALFDACPADIWPSAPGVELLFEMRDRLGLLPDSPSRPEQILDRSVLEASAR